MSINDDKERQDWATAGCMQAKPHGDLKRRKMLLWNDRCLDTTGNTLKYRGMTPSCVVPCAD